MLTILGALLVFLSCVGISANRLVQMRRTIESTDDFKRAFKYLSEKIRLTLEPLPGLLADVAGEAFGEASRFFAEVAEALSGGENRALAAVWSEALRGRGVRLCGCAERIILEAGRQMGRRSGEDEAAALDAAAERLADELRRTEKAFSRDERLVRSAGALVGILIVVLFI